MSVEQKQVNAREGKCGIKESVVCSEQEDQREGKWELNGYIIITGISALTSGLKRDTLTAPPAWSASDGWDQGRVASARDVLAKGGLTGPRRKWLTKVKEEEGKRGLAGTMTLSRLRRVKRSPRQKSCGQAD